MALARQRFASLRHSLGNLGRVAVAALLGLSAIANGAAPRDPVRCTASDGLDGITAASTTPASNYCLIYNDGEPTPKTAIYTINNISSCSGLGGVQAQGTQGLSEEFRTFCCFDTDPLCITTATEVNTVVSPCANSQFQVANASPTALTACASGCNADQYVITWRAFNGSAAGEEDDEDNIQPGLCANLLTGCDGGSLLIEGLCASRSQWTAMNEDPAVVSSWSASAVFPDPVSCTSPDVQRWASSNTPIYITNARCGSTTSATTPAAVTSRDKSSSNEYIGITLVVLIVVMLTGFGVWYYRANKKVFDPPDDEIAMISTNYAGATGRAGPGSGSVGLDTVRPVDAVTVRSEPKGTAELRAKMTQRAAEAAVELEAQLAAVREQLAELEQGWQIAEDQVVKLSVIGKGANGTVWSGTWGHLPVAIKMLDREMARMGPAQIRDFQAVATRMIAIRHPNLLMFQGAGVDTTAGQPFLVFEHMANGSLGELLAADLDIGWPARQQFATDIAAGMQHLHEIPMLHRDLKSANVLVGLDGHAKVADYAQSRLQPPARAAGRRGSWIPQPSTAVFNGRAVGTPHWSAPELLAGNRDAYKDAAIDVFSFAIIMWELLTREIPWNDVDATNPIEFEQKLRNLLHSGVRPDIPAVPEAPAAFVELMEHCWETFPGERPSFHAIVDRMAPWPSEPYCTASPETRRFGDLAHSQ